MPNKGKPTVKLPAPSLSKPAPSGVFYLAGVYGTIGLHPERGIMVQAPKEHQGQPTRGVSVYGTVTYIYDTPENLIALGFDPTKLAAKVKPPKAAAARAKVRGKRKPVEAPAEDAAPETAE